MSKMKIEILNSKKHSREAFSCGQELLDRYLKKQASQDAKKNLASCTVIIDEHNIVKGYYTLSSSSVSKENLPLEIFKKFPPTYTDLPYVLLGRLAIDTSLKRQGFGEIMLVDALTKCAKISEQIGILGVVVDPINQDAIDFYKKYGFILLPASGKMIISIQTIRNLI